MSKQDVLKFDWESKWLKGEEYFYILANMDKYRKALNLKIYEQKTHPESIYVGPQSKYRSDPLSRSAPSTFIEFVERDLFISSFFSNCSHCRWSTLFC